MARTMNEENILIPDLLQRNLLLVIISVNQPPSVSALVNLSYDNLFFDSISGACR